MSATTTEQTIGNGTPVITDSPRPNMKTMLAIAGATVALSVGGAFGVATIAAPQGQTGPRGAQGATGAQGIQGVQGLTGDRGPRGHRGKAGQQGAAGTNGANGANGQSCSNDLYGPGAYLPYC